MENEMKNKMKVHQGHAVKRLRLDKKMSQKELGDLVHLPQSKISVYESQEKLDDEILQRLAEGLQVSVDLIKELEEEKSLSYYIEGNTISENKQSEIIVSNDGTINNQADKALYALLEQMQAVNSEYFKFVDEKISSLQREISELKKQ